MDKNIAALLRRDAKTVHVVYDKDNVVDPDDCPFGQLPRKNKPGKTYTYVTHLDLAKDDPVIVMAAGSVAIAYVMHVDKEVKIEPNSTREYQWVISKIDMQAYEANMTRNAQIELAVADAYRNNLRRSFADQILGALTDDTRPQIEALLG